MLVGLHRIETEATYNTPLVAAAAAGNRDIVTALLQHGAEPNIASSSNLSAIIAAAANGKSKYVEDILIDHGAERVIRGQCCSPGVCSILCCQLPYKWTKQDFKVCQIEQNIMNILHCSNICILVLLQKQSH